MLSRPGRLGADGLTSLNLAMLSTKSITAGTLSKTPVGTGPFQFASWVPNNSFTVKANPSWWGGKVDASAGRDQDDPERAVDRLGAQAGTVQIGLMTQPQITEHLPSSITVQKVLDLSYRALHAPGQDRPAREPLQPAGDGVRAQPPGGRSRAPCSARARSIGPVPLGPYASKPISSVCPTQNIAQAKSYLSEGGQPERLHVHRDHLERPRRDE